MASERATGSGRNGHELPPAAGALDSLRSIGSLAQSNRHMLRAPFVQLQTDGAVHCKTGGAARGAAALYDLQPRTQLLLMYVSRAPCSLYIP